MELTPRQKAFADEWLINGGNDYQAAIKAGYAEATAKNARKNILENRGVSEYIAERQDKVFYTFLYLQGSQTSNCFKVFTVPVHIDICVSILFNKTPTCKSLTLIYDNAIIIVNDIHFFTLHAGLRHTKLY